MTGSRRTGSRPRGKEPLAAADRELWQKVSASVEPLKRRRRPDVETPDAPAPEVEAAPAQTQPSARCPTRAAAPVRTGPKSATDTGLTGIDRRTRQKLARGQIETDERIDLHGSSRATARGRLLQFFIRAQARGHRNVLVITGKGEAPFARHTLHGTEHFHSPERRGVLRQAVTEWLSEPEFTALVSGFQPAHPRHGGGGAFYVRLRRPRSRTLRP